ncbi:hypothetical protein RFI_23848, partial [Reticulomyxa filosa]
PVEEWPKCDVLCAYFSDGFPWKKALDYVQLHNMPCINDVFSQHIIRNRRAVKELLVKNNIPTPKYAKVIEYDDKIIVNGTEIHKPFVEKPLDAEDHNVWRSERRSCIRCEGNYLYEEMVTSTNDIKVYTVGRNYMHAEKRKPPTKDGIVKRDPFNKEVRYNGCFFFFKKKKEEERTIAAKIVDAFKQNVCGFDIVRDSTTKFVFFYQNKKKKKNEFFYQTKKSASMVIDVNGFSFCKNNRKFFDDAAYNIRKMCIEFDRQLRPEFYDLKSIPIDRFPVLQRSNAIIDRERMHILRGVLAVFRHGDRTPKQKYKCTTHNRYVCSLVSKSKKSVKWVFKRNREQIQQFAKFCKTLYLERKQYKWLKISQIASMEMQSIKIQLKAKTRDQQTNDVIEALCILKWGGELTRAGEEQCQDFVPLFRNQQLKSDTEGQAKFLSPIRAYVTEEVRVRKTGTIFVQHLLNTEDIPESTIINGDEAQRLLDDIAPLLILIYK